MIKSITEMELCYANNKNSLFKKYAKLVTWFSNLQLGRDYLDIREQNHIGLLLPNGYHRIVDKSKNTLQGQMVVTSQAIYAPKLYPALYFVDVVASWFNDFSEAQRFLLWQLGLIRGREFLPLLSKLPYFYTISFNPDANTETTSVDGHIQRAAGQETWANIIIGAGTAAADSGTQMYATCEADPTEPYFGQLLRAFMLFDTSTFPANGTLISGSNTVNLTLSGSWTALNERIVTSNPASNTAIAAADFTTLGTVAQAPDWSGASGNQTLNTTGEGNLAIPEKLGAGITKFGIRLAKDADASSPTWSAAAYYGIAWYTADNGSSKPTLTLTYVVPIPTYKSMTGVGK